MIEKEISAQKLAKYKRSSTIKKIQKQLQNQELHDQIKSLQNAHKMDQLSIRLRNIGTAHRNAEQYLIETRIRNKCLVYIEAENRKLAKQRGALAAVSVRQTMQQRDAKVQKHRMSLKVGYAQNTSVKKRIRATRPVKKTNDVKETKSNLTSEMKESRVLSKSSNKTEASMNLNQAANSEDEVSINHANTKEHEVANIDERKSPLMSGGEHAWDMVTMHDQATASGLYLFTVEDKNSGKIKEGKFLIIK